ncbi:MAG: hypothetical protein R2684_17095 [Pyrinomonadaceae bacterium]
MRLTSTLLLGLSMLFMTATAVLGNGTQFLFKKNFVKFNGIRYFTTNSSSLDLGTWGEKKMPLTSGNYVDAIGSFDGYTVKTTAPYEVSQNSELEFLSGVRATFPIKGVNVKLDVQVMRKKIENYECTFVRQHVKDIGALVDSINANQALKDKLKTSNEHRLVTDVLRVHECEFESDATTAVGVDLSLGKKPPVSADTDTTVKRKRYIKVNYAAESVLAYRLHKIKWDKVVKKNRKKIIRLEDDNQGLG